MHENQVNFTGGRGKVVNREIWRNKPADDQEIYIFSLSSDLHVQCSRLHAKNVYSTILMILDL